MTDHPQARPTRQARYEALAVEGKLRQTLAEYSLLSNVSAAQLDAKSRSSDEDIGGKRPPGGIDRGSDKKLDDEHNVIPIAFKSLDHFERRIRQAERYADAHEDWDIELVLEAILEDAQTALKAWKEPRRWTAGEIEPEKGTLAWKRMIADLPGSAEDVGRKHEIGKRTVHRYRTLYGKAK